MRNYMNMVRMEYLLIRFVFFRSNKSKHLHSDGQTDDDEISRKRKKR